MMSAPAISSAGCGAGIGGARAPKTLFDKLWNAHVVRDLGDGWALLHIDRHLLHDLSGPPMLDRLASRGLTPHDPNLTFATPDHTVSSQPGRLGMTEIGSKRTASLRRCTSETGIRFFNLGQKGQGIVHVMGPELGIVIPGVSVVCGDSHTCTNGGLGALAFGIGASEGEHVLATQTIRQQKPRQMRICFEGNLRPGVTAKDLILHVISQLGTAAGTGHAIEFAGPTIECMEVESRLTLCNLAVELGARFGLIAPDKATVEYTRGRPYAPSGFAFEQAVQAWRELFSDRDASFDREETFDASQVCTTVTWGTSPEHAISINDSVPDPAYARDAAAAESLQAALDYMGLTAGQRIAGTPINWVFIGSCANSRLSDLRAAASLIRGQRVAPHVTAWVVPGSELVKRAAEAEGLKEVFESAGFNWREPGCSMCVAANGEQVPPRQRSVSTSNRNFVGRQGPQARTHLASPAVAVASAIAGCIAAPLEIAA
jgi:3-isopropylmalate/(R)-2-methylmalate dehydratase large subunit